MLVSENWYLTKVLLKISICIAIKCSMIIRYHLINISLFLCSILMVWCNCKLQTFTLQKVIWNGWSCSRPNVSVKSQTIHSAPHPAQADYLFLSFYQAATSPHSQISCVQTPNSPRELFCCLSKAVALYKSQLHLVSVHKPRETSPDCLITTDLLSTDVWFKVYAVKILSLIISALVTHITFISHPSQVITGYKCRVVLTCYFPVTDPSNSSIVFCYTLF